MIINFIGDIHIGKRPSHATNRSAAIQRDKVDAAVFKGHLKDPYVIVQLGDLFDSSTVTDDEFVRADSLTKKNILLRGNHDYNHNTYKTDALSNLQAQRDGYGLTSTLVVNLSDTEALHLVPYMPTQELFLEELGRLSPELGKVNILCLHTNMYAEGFCSSEVENNLTEEMAKKLSTKFGLIVSGHEHNRSFKAGCVHMVGSVFPFSFGEMEDKSILSYDTESGTTSQISTWTKHQGYCSLTVEQFLSATSVPDFVEIVGEIQPSEILQVAKKTSWLFSNTAVISIKNSCRTEKAERVSKEGVAVEHWATSAGASLSPGQREVLAEIIKEEESL